MIAIYPTIDNQYGLPITGKTLIPHKWGTGIIVLHFMAIGAHWCSFGSGNGTQFLRKVWLNTSYCWMMTHRFKRGGIVLRWPQRHAASCKHGGL